MIKIGLEIHTPLKTKKKLFCNCPTKQSPPNTNICPICTSQPGSKPMEPNKKAIENVLKISLFLECKIEKEFWIERKHYFYPDLPSNYQKTSKPLGVNGEFLDVGIREVHIEEDPGRYDLKRGVVDFNRSGIPLAEIVTEPEIHSPKQAREFLKALILSLEYLDVLKEDAGIRVDTNISLEGGKRVEVKNINSVKGVFKALQYEILRQKNLARRGIKVEQETRHFDEKNLLTRSLRTKESVEDYRYMKDPDFFSFKINDDWIEEIKQNLPEPPLAKKRRFRWSYGIGKEISNALVSDPYLADFFEEVAKEVDAVEASKWIAVWVKGWANREKIEFRNSRISSKDVVFLIELINKGTLSERNAKWILYDLVRGEKLTEILKNKEYHQISKKDKLGKIVEETVKENSDAVLSYVSGKREALNFLVGEVMRKTKGRAKPQVVLDMIKERIENESVE